MTTSPINIIYTLCRDDGETVNEERESQHVPRIGELITFDRDYSYQIVDVLWHSTGGEERVSIRANELSWHAHIDHVQKEWRRTHS